jgi:ribosomal protein S30
MLRTVRGISHRMLGPRLHAVQSGERAALLLLLEDMHRCHDGLPALSASQPLAEHTKVYCPLADPPPVLECDLVSSTAGNKAHNCTTEALPVSGLRAEDMHGCCAAQTPLHRLLERQLGRGLRRQTPQVCSCTTHELPPRSRDVALHQQRASSATELQRSLNSFEVECDMLQHPQRRLREQLRRPRAASQCSGIPKPDVLLRAKSAPARAGMLACAPEIVAGSGDAIEFKGSVSQYLDEKPFDCEKLRSKQKSTPMTNKECATGGAAAGRGNAGGGRHVCSARTRAQKQAALGIPDVQVICEWLGGVGIQV